MAKIAIVEKYPSRVNYKAIFNLDFDIYALATQNIKRLRKADITIDINVEDYDYIIMVGAESTKYFCKDASVVSHQGYLIDDKFLPIVNPLLVRIKPDNKPAYERAKNNILKYIDGTMVPAKRLNLIGTEDEKEVFDWLTKLHKTCRCKSAPVIIALDTENTALYARQGHCLGFAMAYEEDEGIYFSSDCISSRIYALLQIIFNSYTILFHNSKYDIHFLEYHFGFKFPRVQDTMLMHYLLDESEGTHSLKTLALKYTDLGDYDRELEIFKTRYCKENKVLKRDFTYDLIPFDIMWPYAATDALATLMLYNLFAPHLAKSKSLTKVYIDIMLKGSKFLREMEDNGVPFCTIKLNEANILLTEQIEKINSSLYNYPEIREFEKKYSVIFNVNSTVQVVNLLFHELGLPIPKKKTDTGNISVDKEVLAELGKLHKIPAIILSLKQLKKIKSTYIVKVLNGIDLDGRLRTNFNIHTTSSGRLSSSGKLNMQQLPRDNKIVKACIKAKKGYKIVAADLQTAEMFIAAALSGDKELRNIFASGGDFHSECAILAFGLKPPQNIKFTKRRNWVETNYPKMRQASKAISFGILYGSGPGNVAEAADITVKEAKKVIQTYFRRFPKLEQWLNAQKEYIRTHGYIYSAMGRKRRLKNVFSSDSSVSSHEVRSGVNFLVQSVASDINLLGALHTQEELKKTNIDAKIFALVHDAVLAEVKEKDIDRYVTILVRNLQANYGVVIPKVLIGVDIGIDEDYAKAG